MFDRHDAFADVKFVAVDDGPEGAARPGKTARVHAVMQGRHMRRPVLTHDELRLSAVDRADAPQGLGVAGGKLIPETPDVFPALDPDAVEKRGLQDVRVVRRPAIAHIDQMPRLQPFPFAHHRHEGKIPVGPALLIVGEHAILPH